MRHILLGVVLVAAVAPAASPAAAVTTRDLYMVKDVQSYEGIYTGDFVAVRKTGKKVVGAVGAFNSEYTCLRGKIKDGRLYGAYYDRGEVAAYFTRKWSTEKKHIKGMKSVSRSTIQIYLGSDPRRLIRYCVRST